RPQTAPPEDAQGTGVPTCMAAPVLGKKSRKSARALVFEPHAGGLAMRIRAAEWLRLLGDEGEESAAGRRRRGDACRHALLLSINFANGRTGPEELWLPKHWQVAGSPYWRRTDSKKLN